MTTLKNKTYRKLIYDLRMWVRFKALGYKALNTSPRVANFETKESRLEQAQMLWNVADAFIAHWPFQAHIWWKTAHRGGVVHLIAANADGEYVSYRITMKALHNPKEQLCGMSTLNGPLCGGLTLREAFKLSNFKIADEATPHS